MLSENDRAEIERLARRGSSVSAIARHTAHDRKTVRRVLAGVVSRPSPAPSCLEPFRAHLVARLATDPDTRASTLHRELAARGFDRSYVTFARQLRLLGLRRRVAAGRAAAEQATPARPGAEIQFGWLALAETPWGEPAFVLVGVLAYSGQCRAIISDGTSLAHLVEAIDGVLRRLGGTPRRWHADRMADIVTAGAGRLTAQFARVARHYGVDVRTGSGSGPGRRPIVERAMQYLTRSWWSAAPVSTIGQAQADLDRWAVAVADRRKRGARSIGELALEEGLGALPPFAFAARLEVQRLVSSAAFVAFEGNRYGVAPSLAGTPVTVAARVGELHVEISSAGRRVARHRRAPPGAGQALRAS
jgi:transposase